MDEKSFIPLNQEPVVQVSSGPNSTALLKRGNIALEDGEFEEAKGFFNEVLNIDAECAEAYLGLAMAEEEFKSTKELIENQKTDNKNYQRAKRFADEALIESLLCLEKEICDEIKLKLKEPIEKAKKAYNIISSGNKHTVGLKSDGTVVAVGWNDGGQCNVTEWSDIVALTTGIYHTFGLKSNGTVVAVGYNSYGQCNVQNWKDIVAVSGGGYHTVGLKSNGTVVTTEYIGDPNDYHGQCDISEWKDITAITIGNFQTIGLKTDGTVVTTEFTGKPEEYYYECDVSDWTDIVSIAAGLSHIVGLKSDGTVVAVGNNELGQYNVSDWRDVVAISAELSHTVGLKSDGTVVVVGNNTQGQCNVSDWTDIIAISAGYTQTIGLKSDGTVLSAGGNDIGQCNTQKWKLFNNFDDFENERAQKIAEAKEKNKDSHTVRKVSASIAEVNSKAFSQRNARTVEKKKIIN